MKMICPERGYPKFWGIEGDEHYYTNNIQERLQDWCDMDCDINDLPEEIEMVGADPVEGPKPEDLVDEILENILAYLDDNYSISRDESEEPSTAMKLAALEFAKKIVSEYKVYDCDVVCRKKVKVRDYLNNKDFVV